MTKQCKKQTDIDLLKPISTSSLRVCKKQVEAVNLLEPIQLKKSCSQVDLVKPILISNKKGPCKPKQKLCPRQAAVKMADPVEVPDIK